MKVICCSLLFGNYICPQGNEALVRVAKGQSRTKQAQGLAWGDRQSGSGEAQVDNLGP